MCVAGTSGRPLTPYDAHQDGVTVADGRALVSAACDLDADETTRLLALAPEALAVAADQVWQAVVAAIVEAHGEAERRRTYRAALLREPYRTLFLGRVTPPKGRESDGEVPHPTRTVAVSLASVSAETWAVTETWPLARLLCYIEDRAVAAVLDDIEREVGDLMAGARRG